jgi:UDP-glucose 4-epimerase
MYEVSMHQKILNKCIVTGGAGFIGSHLSEFLLKKNYAVVIIDNFSTGRRANIAHLKNAKLVKADISKKGNWQKLFKNAKFVFHLAALADVVPSILNPISYYNSNVTGTLNVMEACKRYRIKKILYSASSSCYGIPKKYPTNEKEKIDTRYPYAFTKYMGEQLLIHWGKIYKIPYISLRLFNVFGTRSRTSGTYGAAMGVFLAQKLKKKPFTVIGDGKQERDFIYVTDIVEAFFKAATSSKKNKIYNIGSGRPISVNQLVKNIDSNNKKVFISKRPGEPDITHANNMKIKKDLNWKPKISFENGVKNLLKNIDYWNSAPVWTPSSIKKVTKNWFKFIK